MLKNHHPQNRSNPQTQASSMSSTYTYTLDESGGSNSQPASMSSNEPEDDDDICPVCESECTCANKSRNSSSLPNLSFPSGSVSPDVPKNISGNTPPPTSGPPSLRIKLTLPPRPQHSYASSSPKTSNMRQSSSKKKFKSLAETTYAVGSVGGDARLVGSPFSRLGQPLASGGAHDVHLNADGSIPKKRGRPTKAVVAAREAAKIASDVKSLDVVTSQSIGNVVVVRQSKPSVSRRTPQIKSSSSAKKKGKKLHGAAAASRARAQQRKAQGKTQPSKAKRQPVVEEDESSELSELDDDDEMNDLHSFGLPTFVSAFSSSSNSSSSDSGSDTDSDSAKGTPPFRRPQDAPPSLVLGDNDYAQRKRGHRNNWDIRVRKRSVGADGSSDAGMDSGEEEEEDNEADADDNDEDTNGPDMQHFIRYSGIATGWTDDEESSFDADLFFANLSDSTAEASDDEQMDDAEVAFTDGDVRDEPNHTSGSLNTAGFDMMRLSEGAVTGFLAPFTDLERSAAENLPFGHGWDRLSLSNSLKDTILDLDTQSTRGLPLGSSLELPIPGYEEADAMMATSEEEEAVAMFDDCSQDLDEEDGVEIFEDSDGGETTEDEFIDVDGIATPRREVLLRFPASLGAIDPMSTVSSPIRGPIGRGRALSTISSLSSNRESAKSLPKPNGILFVKAFIPEKNENINTNTVKLSSNETVPTPAMGSFAPQASDKAKRVVITSSDTSSGRVIPCPYPVVRRLRGRGTSVSMMSRSGSDRSYRSRASSLLSTVCSPFETLGSGDFETIDDVQLPFGKPIQLDDVIDSAFLEPERSDGPVPESTASETGESDSERDRHLENLRRWDRIPIDAFRKTRAVGTVNGLVDKMSVVVGTPRAPRPSDGFSYGSAVGGMLRGSPLSTTLWESHSTDTRAEQRSNTAHGTRRGELSSLLISPVLLPVRDGDRTPTIERQQQHQQQHAYLGFGAQHAAYAQAQNVKSRKELRKEKKRNRQFFGSAASHIRHNHFPNSKSRATGSMQRSSIPSLSL